MKTLNKISALCALHLFLALGLSIRMSASTSISVNHPVQFKSYGVGAIGWEWNFGDGESVAGIENPVHLFKLQGTYIVTLTSTNGICTETFTQKVEVIPKSSFTEAQARPAPEIALYPNPAVESVSISLQSVQESEYVVRVFDMSGKQVMSQFAASSNGKLFEKISVVDLARGVYLVELKGNQEVFTAKFIKQ